MLILKKKKFFFSFFYFYLNIFTYKFFLFFFKNFFFIKKKINSMHFLHFNFFYDYFFKKYFMQKTSNLITFFFNKIFINIDEINFFYLLLLKSFKKFYIYKNNIYLYKISLIVLLNFFFFCDCSIFLSWIKQLVEGFDLKSHKFIFNFVGFFLNFFFRYFFYYFKIKGYFFSIKGKISGGGNTKKKKIFYKNGSYNLGSNFFLSSYKKSNLNTFSGVLGVFLFITF